MWVKTAIASLIALGLSGCCGDCFDSVYVDRSLGDVTDEERARLSLRICRDGACVSGITDPEDPFRCAVSEGTPVVVACEYAQRGAELVLHLQVVGGFGEVLSVQVTDPVGKRELLNIKGVPKERAADRGVTDKATSCAPCPAADL